MIKKQYKKFMEQKRKSNPNWVKGYCPRKRHEEQEQLIRELYEKRKQEFDKDMWILTRPKITQFKLVIDIHI